MLGRDVVGAETVGGDLASIEQQLDGLLVGVHHHVLVQELDPLDRLGDHPVPDVLGVAAGHLHPVPQPLLPVHLLERSGHLVLELGQSGVPERLQGPDHGGVRGLALDAELLGGQIEQLLGRALGQRPADRAGGRA